MEGKRLPDYQPLSGRTVLVGVSGSIAAYKAVEVVRQLALWGADVHVIMTRAAVRLVGPATFRELSFNPVVTDLFRPPPGLGMTHVTLARKADLLCVCPASADVMARMAAGVADDALTATYLACRAPVVLAPAMNSAMWEHPATQENVARLRARGHVVVGPVTGRLATGHEGSGRMEQPDRILDEIRHLLHPRKDLAGRRLLITAGPTREPLDPVRFLSNRSSGKMGYALARMARYRGAAVSLVSGPTALAPPAGVEWVAVETAEQMYRACLERWEGCDGAIMAAAVADFRPESASPVKIKKDRLRLEAPAEEAGAGALVLRLSPTPDILEALAARRRPGQVLVGFAAETGDLEAFARRKLQQKGADLIVANDVTLPGAGFESDTNAALLLGADGSRLEVPLVSKEILADRILDWVSARLGSHPS